MSYFVVFQNKTFKEEHKQGILWAPQKNSKDGPPTFHWESMKELKKGDVVFSVVRNRIVARGIIRVPTVKSQRPFDNESWARDGWLAIIDYNFNIKSIKVVDHISEIRPFLPDKYSPFSKATGKGNQGYLFPIMDSLGEYLNSLVIKRSIFEYSDIFSIDFDESDMINHLFEEEGIEHGEILLIEADPPEDIKSNRARIRKTKASKIDFVKKTKTDILTGLKGEKLVVFHEKNILEEKGLYELSEKVKWVSLESDRYGYDILSYDEDGNEKYIEVKTTTVNKANLPFDVSVNEVLTSEEKKDNYWVYRVYVVNSQQPKFFKVQGSIKEKFDLEPTTYKAFIKK